MVLEFYNPWSLRGLVKKLGPAGHISEQTKESAVYTRFDTPSEVRAMLPHGCSIEAHRGVRIVTPAAPLLNVPVLGFVLRGLEHALADGPLGRLRGFDRRDSYSQGAAHHAQTARKKPASGSIGGHRAWAPPADRHFRSLSKRDSCSSNAIGLERYTMATAPSARSSPN